MSDGQREFGALASDLLDGTLSAEGSAALSEAVERDPEMARELARLAMLHDALDREHCDAVVGRAEARRLKVARAVRRTISVAAALAVAGLVVWASIRTSPTARASDVVARIVARARTGDRTYVLSVESPAKPQGRRREDPAKDAHPGKGAYGRRMQPPIDGAVLTLRDPNRYVLMRTDADGRPVVSGCDGRQAWIVPADGPARTSADVRRFGGSLPGSRQDLPFINPHESLPELATSYTLTMLPPDPSEGHSWPRIMASRRADAKGGPRTIEIEYDPDSGVIRSMRLGQLPQAKGGPRAVLFELVDQSEVPESYYSHNAHHDTDRTVLKE